MAENEDKIVKKRYTVWLSEELIDKINKSYKQLGFRTKNDLVEEAVIFYLGYLSQKENRDFYSSVVTSTVKSIVEESENKLSRVIFKFAVELAITMNLIAASHKLDKVTLDRLRGECVNEVKRLSGDFDFDTAELWQHGEL